MTLDLLYETKVIGINKPLKANANIRRSFMDHFKLIKNLTNLLLPSLLKSNFSVDYKEV